MATPAPATFAHLLEHAVNEPGILSTAYRQFHNYSLGNQLLALVAVSRARHSARPDCDVPTLEGTRAIRPQGREGDHAVSAGHGQAHHGRRRRRATVATCFVYRPHWFVLAQTDGEPLPRTAVASWDAVGPWRSGMSRDPLRRMNGNCMGSRANGHRGQPGQPAAAQDAVPRTGACPARPHDRRRSSTMAS